MKRFNWTKNGMIEHPKGKYITTEDGIEVSLEIVREMKRGFDRTFKQIHEEAELSIRAVRDEVTE